MHKTQRLRCRTTVGLLAGASLLSSLPASAQTPVTITVRPGGRQTFGGFGVSQVSTDSFARLAPERRRLIAQKIFREEKIKILRVWLDTRGYTPSPGVTDMGPFVRDYVTSGQIALARADGVRTILLAPEHYPAYLAEPKPRPDGQTYLRDEAVPVWMDMLAGFIARLRTQYHTRVDVTGIENEPGADKKYSVKQMADAVVDLRRSLDRRGLRDVGIIAPESSNTGVGADELSGYIETIEKDPAALRAVRGFASHNYNVGNADDVEAFVARAGKQYWMTEQGDVGLLVRPHDAVRAASAAARFLSDVDHLATHWVWFIGAEDVSESLDDPDSPAGSCRLIQYQVSRPGAGWYRTTQMYQTLGQLSRAFDPGAVFRKSVSSLDGDMPWIPSHRPALTAAAAKNPDGTWAIGLSNYTTDHFPDSGDSDRELADRQKAQPAQTFTVSVTIPELADVPSLRFAARRSGPGILDGPFGAYTLHRGVLVVPNVGPLDVITLRSRPDAVARK